jgi:hypothetical protein
MKIFGGQRRKGIFHEAWELLSGLRGRIKAVSPWNN